MKLFVTCLFAAVLLPGVPAQNPPVTNNSPTNAPSFMITLVQDVEEGLTLGQRPVVNVKGVKYTGVFPGNYRIRYSDEHKRIVGYHPNNSCTLTMAFWPPAKLEKDEKFDHNFLRWWIQEQSNNGKIVNESWRSSLGKNVPLFDVAWKTEAGIDQTTRIAFIPLADAIIEVSVMSNPEKFEANALAHADLLGSLRKSDQDGKLEFNRLSNRN